MRSMFPFHTAWQRAPRCSVPMVGLAALALAGCTSDEVSLGGPDDASESAGACAPGVEGVVEGDVRTSTQADVDDLAGCREVTGILDIEAWPGLDLTPLASLRQVGGWLDIHGALESLEGLEALERVGELHL